MSNPVVSPAHCTRGRRGQASPALILLVTRPVRLGAFALRCDSPDAERAVIRLPWSVGKRDGAVRALRAWLQR